jgi:hypothetical protein
MLVMALALVLGFAVVGCVSAPPPLFQPKAVTFSNPPAGFASGDKMSIAYVDDGYEPEEYSLMIVRATNGGRGLVLSKLVSSKNNWKVYKTENESRVATGLAKKTEYPVGQGGLVLVIDGVQHILETTLNQAVNYIVSSKNAVIPEDMVQSILNCDTLEVGQMDAWGQSYQKAETISAEGIAAIKSFLKEFENTGVSD